ncbi:eCIS core domain-containing protein [Nostoc sp. CALU 546]|uniref:eCIS core domain-containing protein n=1 Tax=Nostoc sp. CALU 546 TaxID=1867241 RepID=UPI003B67F599
MSDVGRQATGSLHTLGRQKSATSTFTNPALASSTIPTLASPTRGFGLQTNNPPIQRLTEASIDLQEVQSVDEQLLEPQAIKQQPLNHDISRISLHRPQAKLTVGAPDDYYEQEADKVADQIMRMAKPQPIDLPDTQTQEEVQTKPLAAAITPLVQREAMPEEEEELQTKRSLQLATNGSFQTGDNFETRLNSSESGGSPLPHTVRSFMEPRFGADFSQVRVHTGNEAVQMNRDLNAQAFTHKQNIFFGAGKSPGNDALTAHELTHVVQQTGAAQRKLIQRAINPTYDLTHGTFEVNATPNGASLPITIRFKPKTTAPYSNQIGLIQIVRLTNATGTNVEPQSLPAARGASLRTTADATTGVEGGYFTDVLHNDAPAHGGTGTNAPAGSALPAQYPFGNDPAQPNPATPGLSRPSSSGASGATIGYKRSDDPSDIKAAELTDAPGGAGEFNFDFQTVAKGEDTMTTYGALHWGFQIRAGKVENDNASAQEGQSATFDAALEKHRDFYVHEPVIFYFDFDSDQLSSSETSKIDTFLDYLQRFPDVNVTPEGFADRRGGASQHNLDLSLRRAEAVGAALRAKGVAEAQISAVTIGSGATEDFTPDATTNQDTEANRRGNRRVVLNFRHVPAAPAAPAGGGATP